MKGGKNPMAITGLKYEAYYTITHNKKGLTDEEIIKESREEYDCNLTKKDIEKMRDPKNCRHFLAKYAHNF